MNPASEVLWTPFQSAVEVLWHAPKCCGPKSSQHFDVLCSTSIFAKCCAATHCILSGIRGAQQNSTSISYFYQRREKRMEQERKTHVYRGEFMAALQSAAVVSGDGR